MEKEIGPPRGCMSYLRLHSQWMMGSEARAGLFNSELCLIYCHWSYLKYRCRMGAEAEMILSALRDAEINGKPVSVVPAFL